MRVRSSYASLHWRRSWRDSPRSRAVGETGPIAGEGEHRQYLGGGMGRHRSAAPGHTVVFRPL